MRLPSRVTSTPVGGPAGTLTLSSVEAGSGSDLQALDQPCDEARGDVEVEAPVEAVVQRARAGLLGDGDGGQPEHDTLQRRGDGPRVGDVVAEVGAVVDAGHDDVGREALRNPEARQAHAVHGGAVGRVPHGAVGEGHLFDPQRPAGGDRAGHRRAVAVGGDHREAHVGQHDERSPHREQPFGPDPVVVGEQHVEHCPSIGRAPDGPCGLPVSDGQARVHARLTRASARPCATHT